MRSACGMSQMTWRTCSPQIAYAYFQYIRPAYGKTGATALALLVFFLLVVLMGDEACRRVA